MIEASPMIIVNLRGYKAHLLAGAVIAALEALHHPKTGWINWLV